MKVRVYKPKGMLMYVVCAVNSGEDYVLEQVCFATAAARKMHPSFVPRLNMDEARIYANQRAEFYRDRMEK